MNRRGILAGAFTALGGLFAASKVKADADAPRKSKAKAAAAAPGKLKVVYHLADLDKVSFVLGNIKNHYEGVGGPEHVTVALVVHGPALKSFVTAGANPDHSRRVAEVSKAGLELNACGNTMKAQSVTLNDLMPGFIVAEQGGVVRLAELQSQGYVYLRP